MNHNELDAYTASMYIQLTIQKSTNPACPYLRYYCLVSLVGSMGPKNVLMSHVQLEAEIHERIHKLRLLSVILYLLDGYTTHREEEIGEERRRNA